VCPDSQPYAARRPRRTAKASLGSMDNGGNSMKTNKKTATSIQRHPSLGRPTLRVNMVRRLRVSRRLPPAYSLVCQQVR
jgi:hypothetical protein